MNIIKLKAKDLDARQDAEWADFEAKQKARYADFEAKQTAEKIEFINEQKRRKAVILEKQALEWRTLFPEVSYLFELRSKFE